MPGSTNFKRWDEALANMQSDAAYLAEVFRTGGAAPGIFPKEVFNKLAYQTAVMVAALGEMLAAKGYTVEDGSAGTVGHDYDALKTVLANILTNADGVERTTNKNAANGYLGLNGQKGFTLSADTQGYVGLGRYSAGSPYGTISTAHAGNPNNTGMLFQVKNISGNVVNGLIIGGDGVLSNGGGKQLASWYPVVNSSVSLGAGASTSINLLAGAASFRFYRIAVYGTLGVKVRLAEATPTAAEAAAYIKMASSQSGSDTLEIAGATGQSQTYYYRVDALE